MFKSQTDSRSSLQMSYHHSSEQTLRQLYVCLVRPRLEYASPVWNPYLQKDVNLLEKIQRFACKLRHQLQLPTLAHSKLHMRLCNMNETICRLLYFPPDVICPRVTMPHNIRSHLLYQPYARTNAYFDYYVPSTISHQCQRRERLPEHLCLRRQ